MAVIIGGPGVLFWMLVACIIAMPLRFMEVSLGNMTRKFDYKTNSVIGGPQRYIKVMFRAIKCRKIGNIVSKLFAICVIVSTFFSLQINQTMNIATQLYPKLDDYSILIASILAMVIIFIITKGFHTIAKVTSNIVKIMSLLYIIVCAIIIIKHKSILLESLLLIFTDAFSFRAVQGSIFYAVIMGMKRTFFSCDVGQGISSLVHINSEGKNPIKEGIISMSAIIFITMIAIFCSGLIVIMTKSYMIHSDPMSAVIAAFDSINPYMKYVLFAIVPMFALTTSATWGYFGQKAWIGLFKNDRKNIAIYYNIMLFTAYVVCGVTKDFGKILNLADIFNFSIAIPNIIALAIGTKFIIKRFKKQNI